MRISLLCSDEKHPVNGYLYKWKGENASSHQIELVRKKSELSGGDLLFLVSCSEIVDFAARAAYRVSLVLHASDLPHGRGWSPLIWQVIDGAEEFTVSLLEAKDRIDSGRIWKKLKFSIPKDALWDEINKRLFEAEIELIDFAVREFEQIQSFEQDSSITPTYYLRRKPTDSQIDPKRSIADQFNKIRACDPNRFPAFFELFDQKYKIMLEKLDD